MSNNITLEEIKQKKEKAETEIKEIINKLHRDTSLIISNFSFETRVSETMNGDIVYSAYGAELEIKF